MTLLGRRFVLQLEPFGLAKSRGTTGNGCKRVESRNCCSLEHHTHLEFQRDCNHVVPDRSGSPMCHTHPAPSVANVQSELVRMYLVPLCSPETTIDLDISLDCLEFLSCDCARNLARILPSELVAGAHVRNLLGRTCTQNAPKRG